MNTGKSQTINAKSLQQERKNRLQQKVLKAINEAFS
jgi:hypothetical protein